MNKNFYIFILSMILSVYSTFAQETLGHIDGSETTSYVSKSNPGYGNFSGTFKVMYYSTDGEETTFTVSAHNLPSNITVDYISPSTFNSDTHGEVFEIVFSGNMGDPYASTYFYIKCTGGTTDYYKKINLVFEEDPVIPEISYYNSDLTSQVTPDPLTAQNVIYLQTGFKFTALSVNHLLKTELVEGSAKSAVYTNINTQSEFEEDEINTIINYRKSGSLDQKTKLVLYPNPTRDKLTIENLNQEYSYAVLSTNGVIIKQKQRNTGTINIDISDQSNGVYFLMIKTQNGEIIYEKIVKM